MDKRRILYIDYAKALAMVLVIMGHVNFANEDIKACIYSFHMPAFFLYTGIVLKMGGANFSLKNTLSNKFHRLMIPYLLWAMIYAKFTLPNLLKILYGSSASIVSSGSLSSLWFLPVMFMALLYFYLFIKKESSLVLKILLIIIAFVIGNFLPHFKIGYPWGTNVAITAFAFLLLGNICQEYLGKLWLYFKAHLSMGFFLSFLLCLVMMFALTLTYPLNDTSVGYVMMKNAQYGNYCLFVLTALLGTFMLLFFSLMIELSNECGFRWLSFVGQNTLVIFVVHKPIIGCFKLLFQHFYVCDVIALSITTIGTLIVSCLFCILINKKMPLLAGLKA